MIDLKKTKIKLLGDEIINKIAAGEVVERPASIVKELIENAIDAGATRIKVDLEEGGKKAIVITDNGHGISKDEMKLSVVRHATSKIKDLDDLFSVNSMGFRGEALASISSVSEFSLISRTQESATAYKFSFTDHKSKLEDWSHPVGTSVVVKNLFYNVPVRLKFLRSAQTEFSHCFEFIQSLSLANPYLSFILSHNGKEKFSVGCENPEPKDKKNILFGEDVLKKRVSHIYGQEVSESLLYLTSKSDYLTVEALIAPPGVDKATSKSMFSFVNGRWVKDKVIRYGILRGYHSHILKGRYPYAFCHLTLSPELVDVNVHPSKTELRFQYADDVQGELARGIRDRLRKEDWASSSHSESSVDVQKEPEPKKKSHLVSSSSKNYAFSSPKARSFTSPNLSKFSLPQQGSRNLVSKPQTSFRLSSVESSSPLATEQAEDSSWLDWSEASYQGVVQKCYLIFEIKGKVLFVDQHAFHERILYEKLCQDHKLLESSQSLLIPETLSFEPSVVATFLEKQAELEKVSFEFTKISEEEIEVTAIPCLVRNKNLSEVFADLAKSNTSSKPEEIHHTMLATIACHSAVRAGEELTLERVQSLLQEASGVDFSANCPHGRRVFKWFDPNEIKNWFDRT